MPKRNESESGVSTGMRIFYRHENNEKVHKYKVNDLVEVIGWDEECEYSGMRLYIIGCTRDCDGTPLYVLFQFQNGAIDRNTTP